MDVGVENKEYENLALADFEVGSEDGLSAESEDDGIENEVENNCEPYLKPAYQKDLHRALTSVERPGSFCVEGTLLGFGLPGLEVLKLGPIRFPLGTSQAQELAALCLQAPIGSDASTSDVPSVRSYLQLPPTHFRLRGPEWEAQIQRLANGDIKRGLGVPENVTVVPQLDKLLLYEPGSFLAPHREMENEKEWFATLAVVLPSAHQGGELVVRYDGREAVLDSGARSMYQSHYAAFYNGCEREIRPVKSGHRLVLVYKLMADAASQILEPVNNKQAVGDALAAIRAWSNDVDERSWAFARSGGRSLIIRTPPSKLVIPLKHKYDCESFGFDALKGVDSASADVLCEVSKIPDRPPFHFYLGILNQEGYHDEDDFDEWVCTSEVANMIAPPRESMSFDNNLQCKNEEVEGYGWEKSPNVGAFYDELDESRWGGHAALVLWPHRQHWEIACNHDIGKAIEGVAAVAEAGVAAQAALEESLVASGQLSPGEAALVMHLVKEHGHVAALEDVSQGLQTLCKHGKELKPADGESVTELLVKYGTVEMAETLLLNLHHPIESSVVPALASHFGWATLEDDVIRLFQRLCASGRFGDCFELLDILSKTPEPASIASGAAVQIVTKDGACNRQHAVDEAGKVPEGKRQKRETDQAVREGTSKNQAGCKAGAETTRGLRTRESCGAGGDCEEGAVPNGEEATELVEPKSLTKTGEEREGLCRRAILELVETILTKKIPRGSAMSEELILPPPVLDTWSMPPFIRLIEHFGAEVFTPATTVLMQSTVTDSVTLAAILLWRYIQQEGSLQPEEGSFPRLSPTALTFCREFAGELTAGLLLTKDSQNNVAWLDNTGTNLVGAVMKTLCSLDVDHKVLHTVIAHFVACPATYPSTEILVPAFVELVEFLGKVQPLRASCLAELVRVLTKGLVDRWAGGPAKEKDCALLARSGCSCSQCKQLVEFCHDATQMETTFYIPKPALKHLRSFVKTCNMPLTIEASASPSGGALTYLLCIKKNSLTKRGVGQVEQIKMLAAARRRYDDDRKAIIQLMELERRLKPDP